LAASHQKSGMRDESRHSEEQNAAANRRRSSASQQNSLANQRNAVAHQKAIDLNLSKKCHARQPSQVKEPECSNHTGFVLKGRSKITARPLKFASCDTETGINQLTSEYSEANVE
jgi:hypothetical protein